MLIAAFITFAIAGFMRGYMTDKSQREITYDEFVSEVEHGDVKAVTIKNSQIDIEYKMCIRDSKNTRFRKKLGIWYFYVCGLV